MSLDERTIEERATRERAERARAEHAEADARDNLDRLQEPRAGERALGTSYLGEGMTEESWERWRRIQSSFVDDPQRSVADAHGLVGEVIEGIVRRFESERQQLEQRWSSGEDVSTEDLRHCLQRYRDFFGRLLANLDEVKI